MTGADGALAAARFREAVRRALDDARGRDSAGGVADEVDRLLRDAPDPDRRDELVRRLLEDPPLAASVFQNVDLLYLDAHPAADAVSALLLDLLERAAEWEPGEDPTD